MRSCVHWFCVRLGLVLAACSALAPISRADEQNASIDFNRDVRAILSDNCFQCHGPDEKKRHAGLRLDARDPALQPAESGERAIVPGKPESSQLLTRVTSSDDDLRMPPSSTGKRLTPAQVEVLRKWIREGAVYQGHWAFQPVRRPAPPAVKQADWPRTAIDHFVLARLEREGLAPSARAAKETLIRRVSLDLTGLPPSLEEIDAFLADNSADAYEKVVDRLLKSEHYGERMANEWLDYARYADSNGYQVDSSRQMWPWREWVIRAFNANQPFDQFTIEQIAGDMLPSPTVSQLVATGFNRNHRLNGEGGIIAEEWRVETVIDRVETTGMTWLGLTLNCCRCHDHKYDPISQKEFYQLFAFFNNVAESGTLGGESKNTDPVIQVPTAESAAEFARLEAAIATAEQNAKQLEGQAPELLARWEVTFRQRLKDKPPMWKPLEPRTVKSTGGATLTRQDDATWLAGGKNPAFDTYEIVAPIAAGPITAVLLETFPDASLPGGSLGRYENGNYVLSGIELEVTAPGLAKPLVGAFKRAEASYSQPNWDIKLVIDNNPKNGWAIDGNDPAKRLPRQAIFVLEHPVAAPADATLTIRLKHEAISGHNIGRFRLAASSLEGPLVTLDGDGRPPALVQAALETPVEQRTAAQKTELMKFFRANGDHPLRAADAALATARGQLDAFRTKLPNTMVMRELPQPRDAFFLVRGQYDKRGDRVTAGLPAVFPPLPADQPLNRLGFARWLVDRSNPLTARVWVNRAWAKFFGTGIVKTTENFGSQAEWPSHLELLDWLAADFMEGGWDMKAIQKKIVMSAVYQQSSRATPALLERDPDNRLLARGPRFRLPGELVRDQALALSGLLVRKIGGPSVRPYMPEGVWDETSVYGDLRNYKPDQGDGLYRRTMYTVWKRTAAPPTMLLFDAPTRETCTVKRSRTNTPLQALALLNEVTFVEAARKLGERMLAEGGAQPNERLAWGFRRATGRRATDAELAVLLEGYQADLQHYRTHPEAARQLIATGASPAPASVDPVELAAATLTANILLNLDEVVTRE